MGYVRGYKFVVDPAQTQFSPNHLARVKMSSGNCPRILKGLKDITNCDRFVGQTQVLEAVLSIFLFFFTDE